MNAPQPISTDKLKAMLGGARAIMNKVESGDYSVGNVDSRALTEEGVQQMMAEGVTRPQQTYAKPQGQVDYSKSKMPSAIVEAMINNPIEVPSWNPHATFELDDVADLIEKPLPPQYRQPTRQAPQPQQMNEAYYQPQAPQIPAGMMMVNEAQLKQMMRDFMMDFMATTFTKNLSEEVIKKTIGTLIKEGKITVKSKPKG